MFGRRRSADKADAVPPPETPLPGMYGGSVPLALLRSAATGGRRAAMYPVSSLALSRAPCLLEENELPVATWQEYDKAFCCAWLDGRHAVVGTKCNNLLMIDVDSATATRVPLPPAHERLPRPAGMDSPGHGVFNASGPKGSGMHSAKISPDGRLLACGGADATDAQIFRIERGRPGKGTPAVENDDEGEEEDDENGDDEIRCRRRRRRRGVHASSSSSSTSSSSSSSRTSSYPLAPALVPTRVVWGHHDWVFGLDFITERHLVTGSRDRTLALWVVDDGNGDYDHDCDDDEDEDEMEEDDDGDDAMEEDDTENISPNVGSRSPRLRRRRAVTTGGLTTSRPASAGPEDVVAAAGRRSRARHLRPSPKAPAPLARRDEKRARVRDVACDPSTGRVASLTTHGGLRIWDAHLNEVSSLQMANDRETVCVTMGNPTARGHGLGLSRGGAGGAGAAHVHGLVLAGSQAHVQMYDVRCSADRARPGTILGNGGGGAGGGNGGVSSSSSMFPSPIAVASTAAAAPTRSTSASAHKDGAVAVLESPDGAHGVRSIELRGHLLSIGTGRGRIAFADVRCLGKGWADLGPAPLRPVGVSVPPPAPSMRPPPSPVPPTPTPDSLNAMFATYSSVSASQTLSPGSAAFYEHYQQQQRRRRPPLAETNAIPAAPRIGDRDYGLSLQAAASLGVGAGTRHPHARPATPPSPLSEPRAAVEGAARAAALAAWPVRSRGGGGFGGGGDEEEEEEEEEQEEDFDDGEMSPPADPVSLAAAFEQQLLRRERQQQQERENAASAAAAAAAAAAIPRADQNQTVAAIDADAVVSARGRTFLQSGPGWLCANGIWLDHFAGGPSPVRHAVYAHAWAPGGDGDGGAGGLLAVGGPLATGLKGTYMAYWR